MLDTATKRRIDDCRDILVGKLPDPKAQIEQITIGLIYKFMDDMDKEAVELGGKAKFFSNYSIPDPKDVDKQLVVEFEKYSWDNLFDAKVTATEMLTLYAEAIAGMDKNPNIPQLFRDIFKNAYLPYRDPETLKMFLKTINEFEYSHSEKLGDAFEYLLSVMGSQGDAGQFRTPRHIIDFLVAAVNPSKTDTILDPACGTAGFLISAFKHIKEQNNNELTPDERKKLIQNFVGYDISPDMVRLSLVNLYLHGFSAPHIWEYDTLSSEDRWNENFDVVLANPPFMSPKGGIRPHKKFSISSNRSEVLFVDYIAEHLNPKGRAGIIVPEGVIFQSGTAYKDLRKMLVDNYLYAVISLPAGVFNPYSGVKTSILLMDKELAKTNDTVLFVKVANDGYGLGAQRNAVKGGQLDDALEVLNQFKAGTFSESEIAHIVQKSIIAEKGDYNLSGERYKLSEFINTEYDLFELDKIVDFIDYRGKTPNKTDAGVPLITAKNVKKGFINPTPSEYISEDDYKNWMTRGYPKKGDLLLTTEAPLGNIAKIEIEGKFAIAQRLICLQPKSNLLLATYLKYIILSDKGQKALYNEISGTTVTGIKAALLKKVKFPLPPLSIQEEIVAEIEGYQKIIDGAKMVVENYKPKIDIDPEWEMVELSDVCEHITKGTTPTTNGFKWQETGVKFIKIENINPDGTISHNKLSFIDSECHENLRRSQLKENDILFSIAGTKMGIVGIVDPSLIPSNTNQALAIIRSKGDVNAIFLKHYLMSTNVQNDMERIKVGVAQSNLSLKQVEAIKIPKINSNMQLQIVARIEKEQSLVNANKELIGIFEQKIKDRIGKVWGEKTAASATPNPAPKSPKGDLESADNKMLMAAEPVVKYGKK